MTDRIARVLGIPLLALLGALFALVSLTPLLAQDRAPVVVVELTGVIDSIGSRHVVRAIDDANRDGLELVVIRMDTPGGLDTSMREIIQRILASDVPVAVFVAPEGARAASAGLFLTMAAHVAAMSPNTNIGAAHPVGIGPGGTTEQDETLASKATNDAAAYIRSLAESSGRNGEWAERAVRESVSATNGEALQLGVIDLIANDVPDLLARLDGRTVRTGSGARVLHTAGATTDTVKLNAVDSFLHVLVDPNIAFILFTVGAYGIIAEVFNPGLIFPGVAAAISLILAFVSFGSLPVNWAGVALITLAVALFVLEAFVVSHGVLAGGGVLSLILGGLFLFKPPDVSGPYLPAIEVSRIVIGVVGTLTGLLLFIVVRTGVSVRRAKPAMSAFPALSSLGVAQSALSPGGIVLVESEEWSAESRSGRIRKGQEIRVVGVRGLTLLVEGATRDEDPGDDKLPPSE